MEAAASIFPMVRKSSAPGSPGRASIAGGRASIAAAKKRTNKSATDEAQTATAALIEMMEKFLLGQVRLDSRMEESLNSLGKDIGMVLQILASSGSVVQPLPYRPEDVLDLPKLSLQTDLPADLEGLDASEPIDKKPAGYASGVDSAAVQPRDAGSRRSKHDLNACLGHWCDEKGILFGGSPIEIHTDGWQILGFTGPYSKASLTLTATSEPQACDLCVRHEDDSLETYQVRQGEDNTLILCDAETGEEHCLTVQDLHLIQAVASEAPSAEYARAKRVGNIHKMRAIRAVRWNEGSTHSSSLSSGFSKILATFTFVVRNPFFDPICVLFIIANAVLQGYEVHLMAQEVRDDPYSSMQVAEDLFTCYFILELMVRIFGFRKKFLSPSGNDFGWNLFDTFIVGSSLANVLMSSWIESVAGRNFGVLRVLRIMRVVRVIRIIRVFRFFRELRMMVYSIASSIKALFWVIMLLSVILYVFAIYCVQISTSYRALNAGGAIADKLTTHFGSLFLGMYSLFLCMTSGISWGEVSAPLIDVAWYNSLFMCFFTCFMLFAVLNIITAVFVEGAIKRAQGEKESAIQDDIASSREKAHELEQLFRQIDKDQSGFLDLEEFEKMWEEESMKAYFHTIDLYFSDAFQLFKLLDEDQSHTVHINEFVVGCMRLSGHASNVDVATLVEENRQIFAKMNGHMKLLSKKVDKLHKTMIPAATHTAACCTQIAKSLQTHSGFSARRTASVGALDSTLQPKASGVALDQVEINMVPEKKLQL